MNTENTQLDNSNYNLYGDNEEGSMLGNNDDIIDRADEDHLRSENCIEFDLECDYVPEYSLQNKKSSSSLFNLKRRPANSLDYMKFQSEDYLRYKLENKVRDRIKELNLGNKTETQIFEICYNFYKKFRDKNSAKIRLHDLIPIVAYKFIKSEKIPISHKSAIEKLKLDKSKFLKFSNLIQIGGENVIFKIEDKVFNLDQENAKEKSEKFCDKLNEYLEYIIRKLSQFYETKPELLKIKKSESLIDHYFNNFQNIQNIHNKKNFFDCILFLEDLKQEANKLIFKRPNGINLQFYEYFENKIQIEHLAAAIVKKLSEDKGIKITLHTMRDVFNIPITGISRGIKMLDEFFKNKNINKCKKE